MTRFKHIVQLAFIMSAYYKRFMGATFGGGNSGQDRRQHVIGDQVCEIQNGDSRTA